MQRRHVHAIRAELETSLTVGGESFLDCLREQRLPARELALRNIGEWIRLRILWSAVLFTQPIARHAPWLYRRENSDNDAGPHEHCRICAESCRRCERPVRKRSEMSAAVGTSAEGSPCLGVAPSTPYSRCDGTSLNCEASAQSAR